MDRGGWQAIGEDYKSVAHLMVRATGTQKYEVDVRLKALLIYPWFLRGLLIERKSGPALVLHTRDDRALLELLPSSSRDLDSVEESGHAVRALRFRTELEIWQDEGGEG